MLEDEGQRVLLVLEEHLEAVLRVELLPRPEPGERRLLPGGNLPLVALQQRENVLGVCKNG